MEKLKKEEIHMIELISNFSNLFKQTKNKLNRIVSNKANEETYKNFYQISKRDKRDIEIKLDKMKDIMNNITQLHVKMYQDFERDTMSL